MEKIKLLLIGAFIFFIGNMIGYRHGSIIREKQEELTKPHESLIISPPCSEFVDPYIMQKKSGYPAL